MSAVLLHAPNAHVVAQRGRKRKKDSEVAGAQSHHGHALVFFFFFKDDAELSTTPHSIYPCKIIDFTHPQREIATLLLTEVAI